LNRFTNTHTITDIPLELGEILTSNQMIPQRVKVESQGDQSR